MSFTHDTVMRLIRKFCDPALYPTSLELLRVNLAATVFSPEVRDLLEQYKDDVSRALNIADLDPLLVYLSHFWELLQINNSKIPITWSPVHGLTTVLKGNGKFTLNWISRLHGVSIDHLESTHPWKRGDTIPVGAEIRFNRPERWLKIAKWFSDWENWVKTLPDLTRSQQNRLFITHQLHGDLQRTCKSMYDIVQTYVVGNVRRKWVPNRFSQDVLESFFSEIRQSGGGNTDSCRSHVDRSVQRKRWSQLEKINL